MIEMRLTSEVLHIRVRDPSLGKCFVTQVIDPFQKQTTYYKTNWQSRLGSVVYDIFLLTVYSVTFTTIAAKKSKEYLSMQLVFGFLYYEDLDNLPEVRTFNLYQMATSTATELSSAPTGSEELIRIEANKWRRIASNNRILLLILGVTAIIASLLISAFAGSNWFTSDAIKGVSFVSAVCLAIISSIDTASCTNKAKEASRVVIRALMLFDNHSITLLELIEEYGKGEVIIGNVDFKFSAPVNDT